ncbi:hypothetical protein CHLNCDRAFT_144969 [Chlorella variabilis]|uniref:MCM8/REC winged helix domain-containing protein n=1 Tax=Chlorella variabilis TaxID=554065 RepID=E1ZDE3_CHLVA|nr:hypothetical protein CHLNCDRAFT_144969 [Chlorella variabilis]EFN56209.1 hypothetical protein CHLNCDRAFT_144969 [Chlorella variabilis]|eukprot:XP_005848311.1 hypothetical protein CHLNCDRAFT_144969 [Chlorella variabilis]
MRQTLDSQVASGGGGLECLDFTRGGGGGGRAGSQAGERRRFLEALGWHCQAKGDAVVEAWELQDVADRIVLQAPSLQALIEQLNEAGTWDLLKKGAGRYQVCGVAVQRVPQQSGPQQSGAAGRFAWGSGGAPAASQLSAGSKRGHQQSQQQPPPVPRW